MLNHSGVDFEDVSSFPVSGKVYYANTEPSYLYACSLGIPATVGYDSVEKDEMDGSGNILRKTVYEFHNFSYISTDGNTNTINSRM